MHPVLMNKHRSESSVVTVNLNQEKPKSDTVMEVIQGMQNKDMPRCLRALAEHFAKESTEH